MLLWINSMFSAVAKVRHSVAVARRHAQEHRLQYPQGVCVGHQHVDPRPPPSSSSFLRLLPIEVSDQTGQPHHHLHHALAAKVLVARVLSVRLPQLVHVWSRLGLQLSHPPLPKCGTEAERCLGSQSRVDYLGGFPRSLEVGRGTLRERLPSVLVDPCLYYCCTAHQALAALLCLCTEGCARTARSTYVRGCTQCLHVNLYGPQLLYSLPLDSYTSLTS